MTHKHWIQTGVAAGFCAKSGLGLEGKGVASWGMSKDEMWEKEHNHRHSRLSLHSSCLSCRTAVHVKGTPLKPES